MNKVLVFLVFYISINFLALPHSFGKKTLIPRFVTIKFNEVNVRTGPGISYPIEWIFIRKGEPVEIIAEYEQWRKIRDINGEGGWAHSSVLSPKRSVVLISKEIKSLVSLPNDYEDVVVKLQPGIRCDLKKCNHNWCQVVCKTYKGWILKNYLWGIYKDEHDCR